MLMGRDKGKLLFLEIEKKRMSLVEKLTLTVEGDLVENNLSLLTY